MQRYKVQSYRKDHESGPTSPLAAGLLLFCLLCMANMSVSFALHQPSDTLQPVTLQPAQPDTLLPAIPDTLPDGRRRRGEPGDTLRPALLPQPQVETPAAEAIPVQITEAPSREIKRDRFANHSPMKATMLSVALPGMGQAYNGKYWKIPIIYVGFGAVAYFVNWNNDYYQTFRRAYYARVDGNPNTVDDYPNVSTDRLRSAVNYYRRNLEVSYIAGAALFMLNVLDATVDAHLIDFDVSDDLSLRFQPTLLPARTSGMASGGAYPAVRFTFRF